MRFRDLTAIKVKRILRTPQTQVYLKPARDDEEDDTGSVEKGDAEDGDLVTRTNWPRKVRELILYSNPWS